MFMGAGPELHGYTQWGSKTPELPSRVLNQHGIFPTIFQLLRDARPEAEIGCLYEWDGIKYLVDTLALSHYAQAPDYNKHPEALCGMEEKESGEDGVGESHHVFVYPGMHQPVGDVFQSGNVVDKEHEEHGECAEYVYRGNPLGC